MRLSGTIAATAFVVTVALLVPEFANAHCGGKHTGNHPHCSGGGDGGGGVPAGNPSFVYSTLTSNSFMRVVDAAGSNDRVLSKTLGASGGVFGREFG